MPVPTTQISLEDVRTELGLSAPTSLSACISAAGKTGVWSKLSDFAGYANEYLNVDKSSLTFDAAHSIQNVTLSSNVSWTVTDDQSWILVSPTTGSGNAIIQISCFDNSGSLRTGLVTVSGSGITKYINISQAS